jgi:hypothetical protein
MQKEIIGHMDCPVCLFKDGQIKNDKNGHAFFFCPDCNTQIFTRNAHRDHHLRKRMRPVSVTVTETKPVQTEQTKPPVAANTPPAKPKGEAGRPAPVPQKKAAPEEQKKKSSWFQPILGSE